ncbi:MAG: hypothetical protein P8P83_00735 [Rickettsiaceae bacterium]|nr:hypothetical protein [Rickettsiaceae bacterium]
MKKVIIIFLSIILTWLCGFFYFLHAVNNISNNNRTITDSIVTFGKSHHSLYTTIQLLKSGYAPMVFVMDHQEDELRNEDFLKTQHLAPEQFVFDNRSDGFIYNRAINTALFLERYDFHSLRLVAKAYQFPRAIRELSTTISPDIIIISHPISQKESSYIFAFTEYVKYTFLLAASLIRKENELNLSYS